MKLYNSCNAQHVFAFQNKKQNTEHKWKHKYFSFYLGHIFNQAHIPLTLSLLWVVWGLMP
jgi:hypothetical protein